MANAGVPLLLSVRQVARLFNVQPKTIYSWVDRKSLRATQPGGPGTKIQFTVAEVRRVLCADGSLSEDEAESKIAEVLGLSAPAEVVA